MTKYTKSVVVIVAHPDDETLWAGATILQHSTWEVFVISLCRANDENRSIKFFNALKMLNAKGTMENLDDETAQKPLARELVAQKILETLPKRKYDLIITHNPNGEYTRHLRHEEVSRAVISLWYENKIFTKELWTFAYEDGNKSYLPKPTHSASILYVPTELIWQNKYKIITQIYGFTMDSWEAQTTPRMEAFWQFQNSLQAFQWLENGGQRK